MRQVARRTWGFFERFVGPEDHWLPPDHFQESPVGIIAHHTSPSNIGLLLTSTLAAYDFGYLDQLGLATRLSTTMDTLGQLERFRGHFLNWYDTLTLQPLHPRYISTVDSGNLAASLIVTAQACKSMPDEPVFRWDLWQGYLDTLSNLSETLSGMRKVEFDQQVEEINRQIAGMHAKILAVRAEPERWYAVFQTVSGPFWQDLSSQPGEDGRGRRFCFRPGDAAQAARSCRAGRTSSPGCAANTYRAGVLDSFDGAAPAHYLLKANFYRRSTHCEPIYRITHRSIRFALTPRLAYPISPLLRELLTANRLIPGSDEAPEHKTNRMVGCTGPGINPGFG